MNIVIVGGGICAVYTANKLLRKNKDCNVIILSNGKNQQDPKLRVVS
ncbi:MAG: hypothetical protein ABF301_00595 [Sulfurovum sp.]|jgi:NADH dehydrogenase FAD-containing subunit